MAKKLRPRLTQEEYDILMEYREDKNTFQQKLREGKFTPDDNWSHGWLKTKDASIFIKNPKGSTEIPFSKMREDFIEEMRSYAPNFEKISRTPYNDPHLMVIDIADLHIGKLGSKTETGETYNSKKAFQRAIEGVAGILNKAQGYNIDKILFVIGNDVLHVDNANKSTTKGTGQDVDGMWYDNYKLAKKLYLKIIEALLDIADVHVVHCPSNHDYVTGFMLADSVESFFHNHPNVTFDVSMAHRKYFMYGDSLIGLSHGDGAKMEHLPLIMANEAKHRWADTKHRYIYLHHIHHKEQHKFKSGKDYHGVTVEYLRTPSGTDSWHHRKGFCGVQKAVEGFIHSKQHGQVCRITHIF